MRVHARTSRRTSRSSARKSWRTLEILSQQAKQAGWSYGPKTPVPTTEGGQPSASGEGDAATPHWDVDDGTGGRERYDENGNSVTPEQAHGAPSKNPNPGATPTPKPSPRSMTWSKVIGATVLAIFGATVTMFAGPVEMAPAGVVPILPYDPRLKAPTITVLRVHDARKN